MRRKVSFETLGCRYNRLESAEMAYELQKAGFEPVGSGAPSDVVVINTCTVTGRSDAKARAAIRRARERNPEAVVVVAGCYSETRPDEVVAQEGVDLVVRAAKKFDIAEALKNFVKEGRAVTLDGDGVGREFLPVRPIANMEGRTNAYLKIQSGCGEACSFCIVKVARGGSLSARAEDVVRQVGRLSAAGIKEVVLTGINLGEYGRGRDDGLAALIEKILEETDMSRIRLSSINPNEVTDGLIGLMAESPRVCRHLHIPLQSGSDTVLKRMKRPYTASFYEELLGKIAASVPGVGLGADVMVGFPGETDEEFEQTASLIRRTPLSMLHVFAYSPREGTEAYGMPGQVLKSVKKKRSSVLKAIAERKGDKARRRHLGQTFDVLVENTRDGEGMLKGFTDNYFSVRMLGPDSLMNKIAPVKIVSTAPGGYIGEVAGT